MHTTPFSSKDLHARYVALPPSAKDFLAEKGAATVTNIEKQQRLHVDQAGILYRLMVATCVGLLPAHQFVKTASRELRINESAAKEIAKEINREIFLPLRELLRPRPPSERAGAQPSQSPAPRAAEAPLDPVKVGTPRTPLLRADESEVPSLEAQRLSSVAALPPRERTVEEVREKLPPRTGTAPEARSGASTPTGAPDPYREPIE